MTTLFALILALAAVPQTTPPAKDLNALIDGVDKTFASMKNFSADFIQISTNSVNQRQEDKGHLYLTKDKKMRVNYEKPEEKYWISNGKTLYTYVPANRQVTQDPVNDSLAEEFPIMFMVGRAGLRNEFENFRKLEAKPLYEGDTVIQLTPKRKNQEIQTLTIEVNPRSNYIDHMTIRFTDKSITEFVFLNIEINTNIDASQFEFTPPAGIRVVQGSGIR